MKKQLTLLAIVSISLSPMLLANISYFHNAGTGSHPRYSNNNIFIFPAPDRPPESDFWTPEGPIKSINANNVSNIACGIYRYTGFTQPRYYICAKELNGIFTRYHISYSTTGTMKGDIECLFFQKPCSTQNLKK